MFRRFCTSLLALALIACAGFAHAQAPATPPPGDPRFKTDLLLLVAHPDDDVLAGSYLAKAALDQGRKVAVVFVTRGDAGGNQVGVERAASLGLIREMEARRDLATLGITNVWFLGGRDTPSQNPLLSLANWDHGRTLGEAVRLVRLTRPEVILTWLPMPVVGENHGDHQAAAILATEAFDMAADPTVFPSQVTPSTGVFEPRLEPTMHVRVPIRVVNNGRPPMDAAVKATLPAGWTEEERPMVVRLGPGEEFSFESRVLIPKDAQPRTEVLTYAADGIGSVSVKVVVRLSGAGLPQ
jgi:LmbE family N-acetylglucosaminyl deacetylase